MYTITSRCVALQVMQHTSKCDEQPKRMSQCMIEVFAKPGGEAACVRPGGGGRLGAVYSLDCALSLVLVIVYKTPNTAHTTKRSAKREQTSLWSVVLCLNSRITKIEMSSTANSVSHFLFLVQTDYHTCAA